MAPKVKDPTVAYPYYATADLECGAFDVVLDVEGYDGVSLFLLEEPMLTWGTLQQRIMNEMQVRGLEGVWLFSTYELADYLPLGKFIRIEDLGVVCESDGLGYTFGPFYTYWFFVV